MGDAPGRHVHAMLTAILAGLLVSGCAPRASGPEPREVSLEIADEVRLAEAVRARRGQVVLVDYWATWCGPCVELFPHTVRLHRQFRDRGLAVIGMSMDDPDDEPAVRRFLTEQQAGFENYLSAYGVTPGAVDAFAIPGGGELPYLCIYDRAGQIHKTFGGAGRFTAEDVEQAVRQILDETEPTDSN